MRLRTSIDSFMTSKPQMRAMPLVAGWKVVRTRHGGRLTSAVGAEEPDQFPRRSFEPDAVDGDHGSIVLGKIFDLYGRLTHWDDPAAASCVGQCPSNSRARPRRGKASIMIG